jgi:flavin-dependent dehydrogenase
MAALEIARRGPSVLLVDKARFPRYKVCGCCLNGRALSLLESAGLGGLVDQCGGSPLREFELTVGKRTARVPLPAGASLSRAKFDNALVEAARKQGAVFVSECRVDSAQSIAGGWRLRMTLGDETEQVMASVVLAADGLAQHLMKSALREKPVFRPSSRLGAGAVLEGAEGRYAPGTIYMAVGRGGYVGLVRLEDGRLNVATALDPRLVKGRNLSRAAGAILEQAGHVIPEAFGDADWRGVPQLTRRPARAAGRRILAIGDAAGYVEPFTGEGIGWALTSGREAAVIACDAIGAFGSEVERLWQRRHREIVGAAQRRCRVIALGLRHPALLNLATAVLVRAPAIARCLTDSLNADLSLEKEVRP